MLATLTEEFDDRRPALWGVIALAWLVVGAFAAGAELVAARVAGRPVPSGVLASPMLAAICWVPLTAAAAAVARRWPVHASTSRRAWAANLVAVAAASIVLNATWAALMAAGGHLSISDAGVVAVAGSLRWLHINALVFALLLAGFHWIGVRRRGEAGSSRAAGAHRIAVFSGGRERFLPVDEVAWIGGAGDYSAVHAGGSEFLVNERLKHLERRLDPSCFVRIHRSAIVNLDRVREARSLGRGDREVRLECGTRLRVARRRRQSFEAALAARRGPGGAPAEA